MDWVIRVQGLGWKSKLNIPRIRSMAKNQDTSPMFKNFNYNFSKTSRHMSNILIPRMEI
jgi:hypothetical protein